MHIDEIQKRVAALNAAAPADAPKAKKKLAVIPMTAFAAPTPKTNGHTVFDQDELLKITAARIVAAFGLEARGVTADGLVAGVKAHEKPFEGTVQ